MSKDAESELSRFREQWKEEVARSRRSQPSSSAGGPSHSKQKPRALSGQKLANTRPLEEQVDGVEEDEAVDDIQPAPPASASESSSLAARRESVAAPEVPETALEHYEKAVEKETSGNLGDSLNLYRKAFRMDHRVDAQYKAKHFPRPPPSASHPLDTAATPSKGEKAAAPPPPAPPTGVNTAHHSSAGTESLGSLITSFAGLRIQPISATKVADQSKDGEAGTVQEPNTEEQEEETAEDGYSPLASIPYEILLQIARSLALTDIASFARLGHVCKALCYLVNHEDKIWRDVCLSTYSQQLWDWKVAVDGSELIDQRLSEDSLEAEKLLNDEPDEDPDYEKRKIPVDEEEVPKYDNSWKKMLRLRPRVRFNGVYISTCNYLRQGNAASITWNSPVHIVTYYRYIRFYPDGTLLSLLTTHEPSEVVYGFSKNYLTPAHLGGLPAGSATISWGKHVSRGRWRVDPEGRVDLEMLPLGMDRYVYRMQLRIRNARASGRSQSSNKLTWEGFWSWNRLTDDLAEFSGRNDKPFVFSRVRLVEKELGIA